MFAQEGYDRQFVVVVNDGSVDEGKPMRLLRCSTFFFRPRCRRTPRPGPRCRNRAHGRVRVTVKQGASICLFHDDDDYWPPDRLALGAAPFQDPATALTYGDQHRIDDSVHQSGEINVVWSSPLVGYHRAIFDGLMRGRVYLPFQTVMLRGELCSRLIPFKPVRESEDVDFALRAMGLIHRFRTSVPCMSLTFWRTT